MAPMDQYPLWQRTLGIQTTDPFAGKRETLRQAYLNFRDRTTHLVGEIGGVLPGLTVHDITHLDALWRVADEIAGPDYPLNPAEAFVLGGAFLLHDSAHVLAAYEDRLAGIKKSLEWKDLIAQSFDAEPAVGSPEEQSAVFQVLRHLHAKRARELPKVSWMVPATEERLYLLENFQLREYYGSVIGEIAESHHWSAQQVAERFDSRHLNAPAFLAPAQWTVDVLKLAFLLRTADAAHVDALRAPWFLFALRNPSGVSANHWRFQAKMGQPFRTERGELRLTGSPFSTQERASWWLAYDNACLVDRELRDAQSLMRDAGRPRFASVAVEHASSPETFSANVPTIGWEPVNVSARIGNVAGVIANFSGAKLYGDHPEYALRELIQNSADAIRALRTLGGIDPLQGEITIAVETEGKNRIWLHVIDDGIGMSRHVLTEVLLDFGNSLWKSESLRHEVPGLASRGFKSVGQFGIGFFSVFMLSPNVTVTTRRFIKADADRADQWILEFSEGLSGRPALRRPTDTEKLSRAGTRVSIQLDPSMFAKLANAQLDRIHETLGLGIDDYVRTQDVLAEVTGQAIVRDFRYIVAGLCPTLDVKVTMKTGVEKVILISPGDWETIKAPELMNRVKGQFEARRSTRLVDLREPDGTLVGRVTHGSVLDSAVITYGGIACGLTSRLAGVLLGHNNQDLARNHARPIASSAAWQRWAHDWIAENPSAKVSTLGELHPLCPSLDLALFRISTGTFTFAALGAWLRRRTEVSIVDEFPSHDDDDYVARSDFEDNFELGEDVLAFPGESNLAKSLGLAQIDYLGAVEHLLREEWGDFDKETDVDTAVGEVSGVEINRWVTIYTRLDRES